MTINTITVLGVISILLLYSSKYRVIPAWLSGILILGLAINPRKTLQYKNVVVFLFFKNFGGFLVFIVIISF